MAVTPRFAPVSGLPRPLTALARRLARGAPAALTTARIRAALAAAQVTPACVAGLIALRPGTYTRNPIFRAESFELLAMAWAPGCISTIHDHAGQSCWLCLLEGCLHVEGFDLAAAADRGRAGPHRGLHRRPEVLVLRPGDIDYRGPDNDIHRLTNPGTTYAVSLHVYVLPFDRCLAYDPAAPVAVPRPLLYDAR